MSTMAATPTASRPHLPSRKADRVFFSSMVLLLLATVLWGFGHTYYFAGRVAPNALVHIHGAVFSIWMVLLIVQTGFIAAHRVQWHMKLGMFAFGWAGLMIALGVMASVDAVRRGSGPQGLDPVTFFVVPVSDMVMFALFIFLAYRWRRSMEAHKRLILIATLTLADAAIGRWPIALLQTHPPMQIFVTAGFLVLMVGFDLFNLRRFSRTTLWAGAVLLIVHVVRVPIGFSAPWHAAVKHLL